VTYLQLALLHTRGEKDVGVIKNLINGLTAAEGLEEEETVF